jgi:8-oxo-dGTP diphosphatase
MSKKNSEKLHLVARALIVKDLKVLLTRRIPDNYMYLPGGHLKLGESLISCLKRELNEELGVQIKVGNLLGVIEHSWHSNNSIHQEVNVIFESYINVSPQKLLISKEGDLEFVWIRINDLNDQNIKPLPVLNLIKKRGKMKSFWGTTLNYE